VITWYNKQDAKRTASEQDKPWPEHFRHVEQSGKTKCVGG